MKRFRYYNRNALGVEYVLVIFMCSWRYIWQGNLRMADGQILLVV